LTNVELGWRSRVAPQKSDRDRRWLVPLGLVLAASLFNMVLCFANTNGVSISLAEVAACELLIILLATVSVWRTLLATALVPILLVAGWFVVVRLVNPAASPKILLDLLIPASFYAVGRVYGSPDAGDRMVMIVAVLVLVVALFEWFAFDEYQRLFNVFQYYVGKGDLSADQAGDTGTKLGENGMRPGARELLPFLGAHRVGSVFLEPIAVGNCATIMIAWLMARAKFDRYAMIISSIALFVAVFADDRFAVGAGILVTIGVASGAWRWRWISAALPFAMIFLLLVFAAVSPPRDVDNTVGGRLYGSGSYLLSQGPAEWLAFVPMSIDMDSGYSYLVDSIGVVVPATLWLLYVWKSGADATACRFALGISIYVSLSLCISGSSTSIKTAALMWSLAGIIGSVGERACLGTACDERAGRQKPTRRSLRSGRYPRLGRET
jgi:putative polymerase